MNTVLDFDPNGTEDKIGFPDGGSVDVREVDDKHWRVLKEFEYQGMRRRFDVPVNERTDFASVPRVFVWFIPTYGRYTKAAILHDYLCRLARENKFDRRDADGLFRQAMRTLGVPFLKRWIMWAAVRLGAVLTPNGRKGWLKDAPVVLLIALLVLPIVLPAAIVIAATLLVWYVAEVVVYVPLLMIHGVRARSHMPTKRINKPELTVRL